MKNRKSQAAMEFLMTYGWAIVVVVVAISALAYFGVLNPTQFAPKRCILPTGLSCLDFEIDETTGNIKLFIKNNLGGTIKDVSVRIPGCTDWPSSSEYKNGDSISAEVDCSISNGKIKLEPIIQYTKETSGLTFNAVGSLTGKIGSGGGTGQIQTDPCTGTDTSTCSDVQCKTKSCVDGLCTYSPITACTGGDNCCPAGCDISNDIDCCTGTATYTTPSGAESCSTYHSTYYCSQAHDSNTGTGWFSSSQSDPQWIWFDLGSIKCISGVQVYPWGGYHNQVTHIDISNDASNWNTVVSSWTIPTGDAWNTKTFTETSGRYIRLNLFSTPSYTSVKEFKANLR